MAKIGKFAQITARVLQKNYMADKNLRRGEF